MRIFNNKQSRLNLMLPNGTSLAVDPFALSGHFSLDTEVIRKLLLSLNNEQLVLILEAPIEHSQLASIPIAKEYILPEGVEITPEAIIAYLTAGAEEVEIPSEIKTETLTEGGKESTEEEEEVGTEKVTEDSKKVEGKESTEEEEVETEDSKEVETEKVETEEEEDEDK